jgi:hypothetical protein
MANFEIFSKLAEGILLVAVVLATAAEVPA